jgi:hypothetical protein
MAHGETLDALAESGYRWVAAKAAHGTSPDNLAAVETLLDAASARGMRRAIWVWNEGDPVAEARFGAQLVTSLGAEAFIANPESAYEGPEGAWKSQPFVETFRSLQPDVVLGASVLGGAAIPLGHELSPWTRWFDVLPWLAADADFLPQAYWNMTDANLPAPGSPRHDYRPRNAVHVWRNAGVPASRIHPTLGLWEVPSPVTAAQYLADLDGVEYGGLNTYLMEQYPLPSEYRLIAAR